MISSWLRREEYGSYLHVECGVCGKACGFTQESVAVEWERSHRLDCLDEREDRS